MKFSTALAGAAFLTLLSLVRAATPPPQTMGWNFDTGLTVDEARDLLCAEGTPAPPTGSWLRIRGMTNARGREARGSEGDPAPVGVGEPAVKACRAALASLQKRGYRLVALLDWDTPRWVNGVRGGVADRRVPVDLREAFEHCRNLAATYGDLVDWWEIQNEPDLAFVRDNAETYTAFLKACYLGVQRGRAVLPVAQGHDRSRVLMAPLALPPGAYFEAWARNAGLSYTDGFNYHYYGYAEDFSGIYRQFEDAVAQWGGVRAARDPETAHAASAMLDGRSVFALCFYPSTTGWKANVVGTFDFPAEAAAENAQRLRSRPLAAEEPALGPQGRWWVTPGVTVEEKADRWRFRIDGWPPGVGKFAPKVELPLPAGWTMPGDAVLGFDYRLVREASDAITEKSPRPLTAEEQAARQKLPTVEVRAVSPDREAGPQLTGASPWPTRELPVFLTEYGYGSLDRVTRQTAEGRKRQRRWFESVGPQIRALGIEGAMAFELRPYLEADWLEFGLLIGEGLAPKEGWREQGDFLQPGAKWGRETVSPALADLLRQGRLPLVPRRWTVATPPATTVVIDFVAAKGLSQAKLYGGYFLTGNYGRGEPAEGQLAVYNFGKAPVTGRLELSGSAWQLAGGATARVLHLEPGERRLVPVTVSTGRSQFIACPVGASFRVGEEWGLEVPEPTTPPGASAAGVAAPKPPRLLRPREEPWETEYFQVCFRTANGNLYEVEGRVPASPTWRTALDRLDNFTPAFYARHLLPWRFAENRPVSLVLQFYPVKFPAVYEIYLPQVRRYAAP